MFKKIASLTVAFALAGSPLFAFAEITQLQTVATPTVAATAGPGPLSCFDFKSTLSSGSKNYEVRGLQFALIKEGFTVPESEFGTFGTGTLASVNAFQTKYAKDILTDGGAPTGRIGKLTRAKLNSLYGCSVTQKPATQPAAAATPLSISLSAKNVVLDSTGVTTQFCNQSSGDMPSFPVRIRVNGIIRDFNVVGALKAGTCDTNTLPYGTWGLTYDPGATFSVITGIDPNGTYKNAVVAYPLTNSTTLSLPAVKGAHLAIRGLFIKSNGIQATLCNLGADDLASFPVRVTVNGVSRDLDASQLRSHGQCLPVTWTYDMFNLGTQPAPGTLISATVNADPNNTIVETNEFDNSATILGSI